MVRKACDCCFEPGWAPVTLSHFDGVYRFGITGSAGIQKIHMV